MEKAEIFDRVAKIAEMFDDEEIEDSPDMPACLQAEPLVPDAIIASYMVKLANTILDEGEIKMAEDTEEEKNAKIAARLVKIAKALLGDVMMRFEMDESVAEQNTSMALNALKLSLGANLRDVVYQKFLINQENMGSADHSKFHMFGIFKMPDGTFVGGNAYGRISGPGKHYPISVKEIARGDERSVTNKVESKVRAKMGGRGYTEY